MDKPANRDNTKIIAVLNELSRRHGFPQTIVDVGANEAAEISSPFIEKKWHCLLIEPQRVCVEKLAFRFRRNTNVEIINAGCSDTVGRAKLFHGKDGPGSELATLNASNDPQMVRVRSNEYEEIDLSTLNSILQLRPQFTEIGILKLDTESWDYRVLLGLDLSRFRPNIIVTEEYLWDHDSTISKHVLLENSGYVCIGWVKYNSIWVDADIYKISWALISLGNWLENIDRLPFPMVASRELDSIDSLINVSPAFEGVLEQLDLAASTAACEFQAGKEVEIKVSITNFGTTKLPCLAESGNNNRIYLSYHWKAQGNNQCIWEGLRTTFQSDICSLCTLVVDMKIISPPMPGEYELQLDLIHENVGWLSGKKSLLQVRTVSVI